MPPPTTKELQLTLKFNADTAAGSRAVQELGAQFAKLEQQAGRAQAALGGPGAGGPGAGGGPGGISAMGAAGRVAGGVAAVAGFVSIAAGMTHAIGQLGNEMLSGREKALGFVKSIPLIGGALAGLIDNAMDAIDRIRDPATAARVDRDRIRLPIELAQRAAQHEAAMRGAPLAREAREAEFRAGAVGGRQSVALGARGLSAVAGMFGPAGLAAGGGMMGLLGENNPVSAALEAVQAARREVSSARAAASAAAGETGPARAESARRMDEFRAAAARTRAERAAAGVEADGGGGGERSVLGGKKYKIWGKGGTFGPDDGARGSRYSIEDALNQESRAALAAQQALAAEEAKVTANKERQLVLAQKVHELAKAETNLIRTNLSLLDQERATVKGAARQFGGMDGASQLSLLSAAARFKDQGREGVTAEELGLLRGNALTSKLVDERLDRDAMTGDGAAALKKLQALTGARDLDTIERERQKVKAELDMKVQLDEEQFSRLVAEKMKAINLKDLLGEIIKGQLELNMRRPESDSARGRLERAG